MWRRLQLVVIDDYTKYMYAESAVLLQCNTIYMYLLTPLLPVVSLLSSFVSL